MNPLIYRSFYAYFFAAYVGVAICLCDGHGERRAREVASANLMVDFAIWINLMNIILI